MVYSKLVILILGTTFFCCIKSKGPLNTPPLDIIGSPSDSTADESQHFITETIENLPLEEFKEKIGSCDYPLEFNFELKDGIYSGRVVFEKLGEKEIDRNCTEQNCFIIETGDALERVNFIVFSDLEITDSYLTGLYACAHPAADYPAHSFRARKK